MKKSTLEKTGQLLRDRYLFSLIEIYLSHFCRRADVEETSKLALWVRSTVQREAFALSMIRARIVNQVYSAGQISELINVSRQAVYQMIKDCTPEGWLFIHCDGEPIDPSEMGSCKGVLKYCANDELLILGRTFVDRHIFKMEETFLNKNWADLVAFEQVKEKLNEQEGPIINAN